MSALGALAAARSEKNQEEKPPADSAEPSSEAKTLPSHKRGYAPSARPPAPSGRPPASDKRRRTAFDSMMFEGLAPSELPPPPEQLTPQAELRNRAERLKLNDPVGAARAFVELGVYEERVQHDRDAARRWYEAARNLVRSMQPAVTRLRRLMDGISDLAHTLSVLEDELAVADNDAIRADLLLERAHCYDVLSVLPEARASYAEALRIVPRHPGALRGLEGILRRELAQLEDEEVATLLAGHLERVADAYAPGADRPDGDLRLSAWAYVERAEILDEVLNQADYAQSALERAVVMQPAPGPVRDAFNRHLIRHARDGALVQSLSAESDQEPDNGRAARVLYTAARIAIDKLRAPADAVMILSRAESRAPVHTPTSRRIRAELIAQLEATGNLEMAAEVRQNRLRTLTEREHVLHEHVRLSEIFSTLGAADRAVDSAARALQLDPKDSATRLRLDRALQRLGQHQERIRVWIAEANSERSAEARVAAYLQAADIAERQLRKPEDALTHLRAAWAIDPSNGSVFDAISALLAPPPRSLDGDPRGVQERIELYTHAVHASLDPARKIGLLEKLVQVYEDELGQPARAIEEIERVLEIDPKRRTAILALQRNAERAGDTKRLIKAMVAEADLTQDPDLERRLLLRVADILMERQGDRDRSEQLIKRALKLDPQNESALRAQLRLYERLGRHDDARKTLVALIERDPNGADVFQLWLEVARLDEVKRKHTDQAVEAYQQAAAAKPQHPLPALEIARLLREIADFKKALRMPDRPL